MPKGDIKKVVLAYSGGLDTSIILKWLQTTYGCEVVTFTADLGQGEELEPARKKAELLGIKPENIFIEDLRDEFVRDYVFPMFRANAQYEGLYLLGTSIARPLIAKKQIEIAEKVGADAVCHGATGKGNDQVRFELTYYALKPDITIIAPWREWDLRSREQLIAFAEQHQISARDGRNVEKVLRSVDAAYAAAMAKLPTPRLTRTLQLAVLRQQPPRTGVVRPKLRYAHQGGMNPPLVIIHGSALQHVPDAYRRFLEHFFTDAFKLRGTPLRIQFKTGVNPYADSNARR